MTVRDSETDVLRLPEFFLAVSPEEGELLYLLARASKARKIVEFGAFIRHQHALPGCRRSGTMAAI